MIQAHLERYPLPAPSTVNSPFGPRSGGFHPGIDLAAVAGTPIIAPVAGHVTQAWDKSGGGNWTNLTTPDGTLYGFGHASSFAPGVNGTNLAAGTVIAYVGSTGTSTGPHLHFAWGPNDADKAQLSAAGIAYHAPYADPAKLLAAVGSSTGPGTVGTLAGGISIPGLPDLPGIPPLTPGGILDAAGSVANPLDVLGPFVSFFTKLDDGKLWVRVIEVVGGAGLVVGGILLIKRDTVIPLVEQGAKLAAMA